MSTEIPGIKVETTVTLSDPIGLGFHVAQLASDQQADFLLGLANGFRSFPEPGSMNYQVRALTEDVKHFAPAGRRFIADFVRTLADHIAEVTP